MTFSRLKYLLFALVDVYFTILFFSERVAFILPFFIAPLIFVLFITFFQNPKLFIKQWDGWLVQVIKFAFIGVGLFIFYKAGQFPVVNDFLAQGWQEPYVQAVGKVEGILFVFLATFAQVGFMIGIIFNLLAFFFPKKFGYEVDYQISFFKALIPAIVFTIIFTVGLIYLGSFLTP